MRFFNQLIDKLGRALRITFAGCQLAELSPFFLFPDRRHGIVYGKYVAKAEG